MSLSKPVVELPSSPAQPSTVSSTSGPSWSSGSWSLREIGLLIGIPVSLLSVVGIYYWLSRKPSSSGRKISDTASVKDNGLSKSRGVEKPKPKYLQIKDVGNEMFRKADYAGALESYAEAMKESPPADELAKLYQNRAAVFEKMGDWVQLIIETSAAIEIDPKYIKARHRRAKAYQKTGFLDEVG